MRLYEFGDDLKVKSWQKGCMNIISFYFKITKLFWSGKDVGLRIFEVSLD